MTAPAAIEITEPGVYLLDHRPSGDVEVWKTAEENWIPVELELVDAVISPRTPVVPSE